MKKIILSTLIASSVLFADNKEENGICINFTANGLSTFADITVAIVTIILAIIAWRALGQIKEMKVQNQNDAVDALYTRMFELQKLMLESPDFREYLLGTKDGTKAYIVLEMYADFLEQVILQMDYLPIHAQEPWEHYICETIKKYGALKGFIEDHLASKSSHLSEKLKKYILEDSLCNSK